MLVLLVYSVDSTNRTLRSFTDLIVWFLIWLSVNSRWKDLGVKMLDLPILCCCFSVTKLCPTLCNSMDCSMPGSSALHYLLEFAPIHVCWVCDAVQPSHPLSPLSPPALNLAQPQSFPVSWLFASGGQSIGASALVSVLPMNIQGWFPLVLTGWISLQSKQLSGVFFSIILYNYPF